MDTRFWGPSGWYLLHLIATDLDSDPHHTSARRKKMEQWFSLLPFVLPCRYCRESLHEYYTKHPVPSYKTSENNSVSYEKWMYVIHNCVNDKLRKQGFLHSVNPKWEEIRDKYRRCYTSLCKCLPFMGWDFMHSIAYSTPSIPKQRVRSTQKRTGDLAHILRLKKLVTWWKWIPSILPCPFWRKAWSAAVTEHGEPPLYRGKHAMMRWMWKIETSVCSSLRCDPPHDSYGELCHNVSSHSSLCEVVKKQRTRAAKTCRKRHRRNIRHSTSPSQFLDIEDEI
jgi:hypothetical protein